MCDLVVGFVILGLCLIFDDGLGRYMRACSSS